MSKETIDNTSAEVVDLLAEALEANNQTRYLNKFETYQQAAAAIVDGWDPIYMAYIARTQPNQPLTKPRRPSFAESTGFSEAQQAKLANSPTTAATLANQIRANRQRRLNDHRV